MYHGKDDDIEVIYSGTITYIFKYNKRKLKYEFKEKREFAL